MALLKMYATVNTLTGASIAGGSTYVVYNTDNIIWGTLASKTGTTASSSFDYVNANGTIGPARVKASVGLILASAGALTLNG
jgi:hypothetical protein